MQSKGSEKISIKWTLNYSSNARNHALVTIAGSPKTVYVVQTTYLDNRETVLSQKVDAFFSQWTTRTCTATTCAGTANQSNIETNGGPMSMDASLNAPSTMVAGQTRELGVTAQYNDNGQPLSGVAPRTVNLFFSRGSRDPNTLHPILSDHAYGGGSPYNSGTPVDLRASQDEYVATNIFGNPAIGTTYQSIVTNLLNNASNNNVMDWVATFNEQVRSSTPQEVGTTIVDGAPSLSDTAKAQYDEQTTGTVNYESRWVLNAPRDPSRGSWSRAQDSLTQGGPVFPGNTAAAVPLAVWHYQPRAGSALFRLDAPASIRNNVVLTALVDRDHFPGLGGGAIIRAAQGPDLNICRPPNAVYNYEYRRYHRAYARLQYRYVWNDYPDIYHPATKKKAAWTEVVGHTDGATVVKAGVDYGDRAYYASTPPGWDGVQNGKGGMRRIAHYKMASIVPGSYVPTYYIQDYNQSEDGTHPDWLQKIIHDGSNVPLIGDVAPVTSNPYALDFGPNNNTTAITSDVIGVIPDYYYKRSGYLFNDMDVNGAYNNNQRLSRRSLPAANKPYVDPDYFGNQANVPTHQTANYTENTGYDTGHRVGTVEDRWHRDDCPAGVSTAGESFVPQTPAGWDNATSFPAGEYYVVWFYVPGSGVAAPSSTTNWRAHVDYWRPDGIGYGYGYANGSVNTNNNFLRVYNSRVTG